MSKYPQWRALIDASRPGGVDLDQPEFSELNQQLKKDDTLRGITERSHAFDEKIQQAIVDVEVPEGLADRLLMELAKNSPDGVLSEEAVSSNTIVSEPVARSNRRRRVILAVVAAVASAAAILVAVMLRGIEQPQIRTAREFAEAAGDWAELLSPEWNAMSTLPAANLAPVEAAQLRGWRSALGGWQSADLPTLGLAVCYDLKTGDGDYLFVIPAGTAVVQPATPPLRPDYSASGAAGFCVAVWKNRGSVYVLVLQGSTDRYRRTVRPVPPLMAATAYRTAAVT